MFIFLTILVVAISLSMDTFSLSLSYGFFNISRINILKISFFVGLFHFFMPLIGNICGEMIFKLIPIEEKKLIGIIFLTISIELIISLFKGNEIKPIKSIKDILLFSFTVSIDSFITGTCLDVFETNNILISIVFMIVSSFFTYLGLSIGSFINIKAGKNAELIGLVLLISLSFFYLVY